MVLLIRPQRREIFSFPFVANSAVRIQLYFHHDVFVFVEMYPLEHKWRDGVEIRCLVATAGTTGVQSQHVVRRNKWRVKCDEDGRDHHHRRPISPLLINWMQMVCLHSPISGTPHK